jgi:hypothetical protein
VALPDGDVAVKDKVGHVRSNCQVIVGWTNVRWKNITVKKCVRVVIVLVRAANHFEDKV